tara:strand:- start:1055 stop:1243 length:189 start_codon:yes stop_codon:yes gene_type:complete
MTKHMEKAIDTTALHGTFFLASQYSWRCPARKEKPNLLYLFGTTCPRKDKQLLHFESGTEKR